MKKHGLINCILFLCFLSVYVYAGGGAENVLLVVNSNSESSIAVANEYIYLRQIPSRNVVYLDIDTFSDISVDQFRDKILTPLINTIQERKIANQIDYIIYSTDFPWRVNFEKDLGEQSISKTFGKSGSITGMTYLYQYVLRKNLGYLTLNSNLYYRKTFADKFIKNAKLNLNKEEYSSLIQVSELMSNSKFTEAEFLLKDLVEKHKHATLFILLAKCYAQQNNIDDAIVNLKAAVEYGWSDENVLIHDSGLANLQRSPELEKLVNKITQEKKTAGIWQTQGFRSYYNWQNNGQISTTPDANGIRYVISNMLGVTNGRGNSIQEVISSLRTSKFADFSQPRGTIYFMRNDNIRSKTRHNDFPQVVEKLKSLGVNAVLEDGIIPQQKSDIMGTVIGTANFSWGESQNKILPGAICEHLTSFGAKFDEDAGQTPISEFIRFGAGGTSGTVVEPYALQAKFPTPWIHLHYASGASLGEAFYQSVQGPYQLLIIGDPLCQPWAKKPYFLVSGLQDNQVVKNQITLKFSSSESSILHYEVFFDGLMIARTQDNFYAIDSNALPDGSHELRIVATAANNIQTQSSRIIPFVVQNKNQSVKIVSYPKQIHLGDVVELEVQTNYGDTIDIYQNLRQLLSTTIGKNIKLDSRILGVGKVEIYAISYFSQEKKPVYSEKITIDILMPTKIEPLPPKEITGTHTPGIKLLENDKVSIKEELTKNRGLLKVAKNSPIQIECYVNISQEGIYQIETFATGTYAININNKFFLLSDAKRQSFLINLSKGIYKILLKGISDHRGLIDIKFGEKGRQSLSRKNCHIYQ